MGMAWFLLYLLCCFMVPNRKLQRGYIWRTLRKLPPFRRWPRDDLWHQFLRFQVVFVFWFTLIDIISPGGIGNQRHPLHNLISWGFFIVLMLDDYVNGDDDNIRRLFKWAKNKIKWAMELPPVPTEVRDAA